MKNQEKTIRVSEQTTTWVEYLQMLNNLESSVQESAKEFLPGDGSAVLRPFLEACDILHEEVLRLMVHSMRNRTRGEITEL